MGDINRVLGLSGKPATLHAKGRAYPLGPITKALQARYEAWLEDRERRAATSWRGKLPPDEYRQLLRDTSSDIASGRFSFFGAESMGSVQTMEGASYFMYLLASANDPDFTEEQALQLILDAKDEIEPVLMELLGNSRPPATTATTPGAETG